MGAEWFGLAGAVVPGPLLGVIGITFGVASGQAGWTGWGRRWAVGLAWAAVIYGGTLLSAGLVALVVGQPDHVWFSLIVVGLIGVSVFGPWLGTVGRRYQDAEDRRMLAADLG